MFSALSRFLCSIAFGAAARLYITIVHFLSKRVRLAILFLSWYGPAIPLRKIDIFLKKRMCNVYPQLLEHMNRQPFLLPHPSLPSGIEIPKALYSEDEAELLTRMTAVPDTPENIAQRAGREIESVARF